MKEADIRPPVLYEQYLALVRRDAQRLLAQQAMFVPVACPACGETAQTPGLDKLGYSYVSCPACASLYLSPRPRPAQVEEFYRSAESVTFFGTQFYQQTVEARRRELFRPRALEAASLLGAAAPAGASYVDIGAGYGVLLEEVQRTGAFTQIVGIEPNPAMATICRERGFEVIDVELGQVRQGSVQADVATSFEVLEHVYDPLQFLAGARALLKPHGRLLFTTLTVSGFDIQVLWEHAKCIVPPQHLNFISVEGMATLVERAGLRVLELSTPGRLDVDIVACSWRENPAIPLPRFLVSLLTQRDESARLGLQAWLQQHRLSSHVRVVAAPA